MTNGSSPLLSFSPIHTLPLSLNTVICLSTPPSGDSGKLPSVYCFDCYCSLWFVVPSYIWTDDGLGHTFGIFLLFCNPWLYGPLLNKVDNDDHVVKCSFFPLHSLCFHTKQTNDHYRSIRIVWTLFLYS